MVPAVSARLSIGMGRGKIMMTQDFRAARDSEV